MRKSTLCKAIALATALSGLGAGLYAPAASAVALLPVKVGDVLIFPYYTARDGWQTTLTFINTSDNFLAVKFRFMEGVNSRDVLDFNVVMSPYDVYTGVVEAGNGTYGDKTSGIRFRIPALETTCTAPYLAPDSSFGLNSTAYTGVNADGGPTGNDRLFEGYVIAMVMGHANKADLQFITQQTTNATYTEALKAAAATLLSAEHPNTAAECTAVQNLFLASEIANTAKLFGEPLNVLKGNYSLLNVPRGTAAGGNAVTLSHFFNVVANTDFARAAPAAGNGQADLNCTVPYSRQFNYAAYPGSSVPAPVQWVPAQAGNGAGPNAPNAPGNAGGCPNLITPQMFPYFLEPSLNDTYNGGILFPFPRTGIAIALENDTIPLGVLPTLYSAYQNSGFQAVSETLRATTATNEWSVNPALGVATDWVITHPTKSFFVDDPTHASTTASPVPPLGTGTPGNDVVQAAINQARFRTGAAPAWLPVRPASPLAVGSNSALNPFPASFSATTDATAAGKSCVLVGINIWDRDELTAVTGITPSPIEPTALRQLCYEVNVLNFNDPAVRTVFGSTLGVNLNDDVIALQAAALAAGRPAEPFGWLQLNFTVDPAAKGPGILIGVPGPRTSAQGTTLRRAGLPVIGFMMRERVISTTDVAGNYGDLAEHSYTR